MSSLNSPQSTSLLIGKKWLEIRNVTTLDLKETLSHFVSLVGNNYNFETRSEIISMSLALLYQLRIAIIPNRSISKRQYDVSMSKRWIMWHTIVVQITVIETFGVICNTTLFNTKLKHIAIIIYVFVLIH